MKKLLLLLPIITCSFFSVIAMDDIGSPEFETILPTHVDHTQKAAIKHGLRMGLAKRKLTNQEIGALENKIIALDVTKTRLFGFGKKKNVVKNDSGPERELSLEPESNKDILNQLKKSNTSQDYQLMLKLLARMAQAQPESKSSEEKEAELQDLIKGSHNILTENVEALSKLFPGIESQLAGLSHFTKSLKSQQLKSGLCGLSAQTLNTLLAVGGLAGTGFVSLLITLRTFKII